MVPRAMMVVALSLAGLPSASGELRKRNKDACTVSPLSLWQDDDCGCSFKVCDTCTSTRKDSHTGNDEQYT